MDLNDDQRQRAIAELHRLRSALEASSLKQLRETILAMDITVQQLKVLMLAVTSPRGTTGQALAHTLNLSMATVSGITDRLAAQGMVERFEDEDDHRVRRVAATDRGRKSIELLASAQAPNGEHAFNRMAIADLEALGQGLKAYIAAAEPHTS